MLKRAEVAFPYLKCEKSRKLHLFNKLLIRSKKEEVNVKKMVEIKSPVRLKDLEGKFGILFKVLMAERLKKELFDTDKIVAINLKREECIALIDKNENFWELLRKKKGRYTIRRLKNKHFS
jgi:hypothetical protein